MHLQRGAWFSIPHNYNVALIVDTGAALDILPQRPGESCETQRCLGSRMS